jgi:hypothetical protein
MFEKALWWLGSRRDDIRAFPEDAPMRLNPDYCAASLPVVTGRVKVPTMGDFPFAHLA